MDEREERDDLSRKIDNVIQGHNTLIVLQVLAGVISAVCRSKGQTEQQGFSIYHGIRDVIDREISKGLN